MSPNQAHDILLHSFESAAVPASYRRDSVDIPSAANAQMPPPSDETIFRTARK